MMAKHQVTKEIKVHHIRNVHVPEARLGALLPPKPLTGDSNFPEDVPDGENNHYDYLSKNKPKKCYSSNSVCN